MTEIIPSSEWLARASAHRERVAPWTDAWRTRKAARNPHPVFDFLFTYYSFSPAKLERWSPGWRLNLSDPGDLARETIHGQYLIHDSISQTSRYAPEAIPEKAVKRLKWILELLEMSSRRPAQFGCFGLHEWAMVYKSDDIRHQESTRLRLPQDEVNAVVESRPLCCTHYDAFRFFTPSSIPLNRHQPTYETRQEMEQTGCIHTNMDLYKWAYKSMPWIGSDILWQCFEFALACREIDMRASPYDLERFGYSPIKIETIEGRRSYEEIQRDLANRGRPLRKMLITEIHDLLASVHRHAVRA